MRVLERYIQSSSRALNWFSGAAVVAMMLLTCADVVLRFFHHPIAGTYELVGFLGVLVISFSLAYTSVEKGHIAVELLVERLPKRVRSLIDAVDALIGTGLFGLIAWQSALYGLDLKESGEVSLTLGIVTYPFVFGIAAGCSVLCAVLMVEFALSLERAWKR
ncbi:MAG: TRAP transporter small permease [Syntrophales bacterium]